MNKFTIISATALFTLTLGACAGSGSMNAGERISERGGEITQYGDAWSSGNKEVRNGQRMIDKSNKQIADARKKLANAEADQAKAQQMIIDGTSKMQRSEAEYAATRAGPAATTIPQPN
jgi:septal ring factor EnvC (AmiA/AmiB activator)